MSSEPQNQKSDFNRFKISGMDCASCARSIETAVSRLDGVDLCEISFATEMLRVEGTASRGDIEQVVQELGYQVVEDDMPEEVATADAFFPYMWRRWEGRLALVAALLMIPGLILSELLGREHLWIDLLSLVALVLAGWPVARSAWKAVRINREININVLMTIAALGAVMIGALVEAGMVVVLFAIGEGLEGFTTGRARRAIQTMVAAVPETATRLVGGAAGLRKEQQVKIDRLAVGDLILVRPGEKISMDGIVVGGQSAVNQAAITGESRLIEKDRGDTVFAGTINGGGVLEIEVNRPAVDNTIQRMIRLVEEAQERRAPAQRFVDRFAAVYTPIVMVIAVLTAVVPPLFFDQPFLNPGPDTTGWLYRGLALLVVACPCALVISTPVAVISAISSAAQRGILVKGGAFLEHLSQIKVVAFDKTGTLTSGQPAVVDVSAADCVSPAGGLVDCPACVELLALAEAVESQSEHPLAYAILSASENLPAGGRLPAATDVQALVGRGISGNVAGRSVVVGSHRWFDDHVPHSVGQCEAASAAAAQGYTPMMVGADKAFVGTITVADTVRHDSREVVEALTKLGLKTIMLTGDEAGAAAEIGRQVGVDQVQASLLPQEKVDFVRHLQSTTGPVAMVGDGLNDAPALAAADVGIAIGGAGATAQALETADITLMQDALSQLPFTFTLARKTMATIRANVIFSILVKVVFLVLVLIGWGTMWMAVVADVGTTVVVVLYGMRLLRIGGAGEPDNF